MQTLCHKIQRSCLIFVVLVTVSTSYFSQSLTIYRRSVYWLPYHSPIATSSIQRDISSLIFGEQHISCELVNFVRSNRTDTDRNRCTTKPSFVQRAVSYGTYKIRIQCYPLSHPGCSHVATSLKHRDLFSLILSAQCRSLELVSIASSRRTDINRNRFTVTPSDWTKIYIIYHLEKNNQCELHIAWTKCKCVHIVP